MTTEPTFSAVILAGGRATRMGGADKGLQCFQGQSLFAQIAARLRPQVAQISINANRNQREYGATGLPVFGDDLPDFQGPMSGILSALERAQTDWVLFVPCDSPFLPLNLLEKLKRAVLFKKVFAAYAHDGERDHPTFCLLHKELKGDLAAYLASGERRMLHFMRQQQAAVVDFSEQKDAFINMNTLADLAHYAQDDAR